MQWMPVGRVMTGSGLRNEYTASVDVFDITMTAPPVASDDDFLFTIERGGNYVHDGIASSVSGVENEVKDWIKTFG